MRNNLIIVCLLAVFLKSPAQTPVGSWSDHLNYSSFRHVVAGNRQIFASTGSSIMIYDQEKIQLRRLSTINGLSETGISAIAWSEDHHALVVAFSTTNIDIIKGNTVYNIPDIERKQIAGRKEINKIRIRGQYAYLACSFGIVIIDIIRTEIFDTWKPGTGSGNCEVLDVAFGNGEIFAATDIGVFSADISNPGLAYYANWSRISTLPSPAARYSASIFSGNKLYVNQAGTEGDSVFSIGTQTELFLYDQGVFNTSFDSTDEGFIITGGNIRIFNNNGTLVRSIDSYGFGTPNALQTAISNNGIYIADFSWGLIEKKNSGDYRILTLPGPVSNDAINVCSHNGKTIICSGGIDASWNNLWNPMRVSVSENNSWSHFSIDSISDPLRSAVDNTDSDHFFLSTWGGGLLEIRNNTIVKQYTEKNSPLQTIIPDKPYVRICGLAMDKGNNLWITQTEVPGSIKILKPDGSWIVNPVTINSPTIGDIIISRSGKKWIVLPRGNGFFVLDDNSTPDYFDDDLYKKMLVYTSDNEVIQFVYCIAEDLDGNIWVGTDQGPVIYYNPDRIFESDIKAYRIKIPRNDGSGLADYMLGTETITSIAVDGSNRKWLGTAGSGAYLLSADGTSQILSFNEDNSPLFSNSVPSVAVDNKTGDVWFATTKGILSYRGNAIEGLSQFTNVYAFPNPVREDYNGIVTITGLMRDTQIRITDISGNLVYKTVSDGGQASWDLMTYKGRRVATGVYMIFCTNSDGSQSCVIKLLVIS